MENEKEFYTHREYNDAIMNEWRRFMTGEIRYEEIDENASKFKSPALIEFIEKTNNIKLEHWQKTLLTSLYYGNKISYTGSRRYGKKILVDGVKEYRRQIEDIK